MIIELIGLSMFPPTLDLLSLIMLPGEHLASYFSSFFAPFYEAVNLTARSLTDEMVQLDAPR